MPLETGRLAAMLKETTLVNAGVIKLTTLQVAVVATT